MEEVQFPAEAGEDQVTLVRFWQQVHNRMHAEHPELVEKHLLILEDTNPYGRLYAATALNAIMDVIDNRRQTEARQSNESTQSDYRKMA